MKKIELKRTIQLPGTKTILKPGEHLVEDKFFSDWFIKGLIIAGDIVIKDIASSVRTLKPSGNVLPKKVTEPKPVPKPVQKEADAKEAVPTKISKEEVISEEEKFEIEIPENAPSSENNSPEEQEEIPPPEGWPVEVEKAPVIKKIRRRK
jgi:hypothetical protein